MTHNDLALQGRSIYEGTNFQQLEPYGANLSRVREAGSVQLHDSADRAGRQ